MTGPGLAGSDSPLATTFDLAMLDLDGVVYVGPDAVDGVPEVLRVASQHGMRLAYVTNNASRPPEAVAEHLRSLGVDAAPADVVTSAQAAARMLAEILPSGSKVLLVGGEGLVSALTERDLVAVHRLEDEPVAVVQGFSPDLRWSDLAEGAYAVQRGLPWVATNTDMTVPTPRGRGPGNGTLVAAIATATGRQPMVAGKPEPVLFAETARRVGGSAPLVVGDRLDTDIAGARRFGCPSLLVLTGVTGVDDLVRAPRELRPDYVSMTLDGLLEPHPQPSFVDGWWRSGRAAVRIAGSDAHADEVEFQNRQNLVSNDALRALVCAAWAHVDDGGSLPDSVLRSLEGVA